MKQHRRTIEELKRAHGVPDLSDAEIKAGREELLKFMQANPVRKDVALRRILHKGQGKTKEFFPIINLLLKKKHMFATIAVVLALALGGGATYAAEAALPGELLYPIKVNVNEQVRAAAAIGAEADAKWDARRAERRLEEAAVLAATGKLNEETRLKTQNRFEVHVDKAQARIEKIRKKKNAAGSAEVASRLEASLKAHERFLSRLASDVNGQVEVDIKPLIAEIKAEIKESAEARTKTDAEVNAEAKPMAKTAAEGRMRAARSKIDSVVRFVEGARIDPEGKAEAKERVEVAERIFAEGEAQLESEAYGEAFATFGKAHRQAQEAKAYAQTQMNLNVRAGGLKIRVDVGGSAESDEASEPDSAVETEDRDESESEEDAVDESGVEADVDVNANIDASIDSNGRVKTGVGQKVKTRLGL